MVTYNYPEISEGNYPAFLEVVAEFFPQARTQWPSDCEGWLSLCSEKQKEDKKRADDDGGQDAQFHPIPVTAAEFREQCRYRSVENSFKGSLREPWRCIKEAAQQQPRQILSEYDPLETDK